MKKSNYARLTASLGIALLAAPLAQADNNNRKGQKHYSQRDFARVVDVQPVVETIRYKEPYEACHYEQHSNYKHRSSKALLLGSVIGGAIGHKIGYDTGHHPHVTAVAGALIGGSIASDIDRRKKGDRIREEKVCTTRYEVSYKEVVTGYDVAYRYRGKIYYTTMDEHPGKRIPVKVTVRPAFHKSNRY